MNIFPLKKPLALNLKKEINMNEQEWKQWLLDARACLICTNKYSNGEISQIINWFYHIRGSDERALIGDEAVDALSTVNKATINKLGCFDLYISLMARLFIYAPLILKERNTLDAAQ